MEAGGIVEAMSMAEGALFRFSRTGDYFEPPCWMMGTLCMMERPMGFQISVKETIDGTVARISLHLRGSGEQAPTWELCLGMDGKWDGRVFSGGRAMFEGEWEIDSAIAKAVRYRNAALE